MANETIDPVVKAQQEAEAALAKAEAARDGAELQFLDGVTHLKQISEGRTAFETNRLKSRYLSVFGLTRWTALVTRSR